MEKLAEQSQRLPCLQNHAHSSKYLGGDILDRYHRLNPELQGNENEVME